MVRGLISMAVLVLSNTAAAQYDKGTWLFEVIGGPVSPSNPSVTVRLYAAFPKITSSSAFGAGGFNVLSDDPNGEFFGVERGFGLGPSPFCGYGFLGTPTPSTVPGNVVGQLGILGCVPGTAMPLLVWQASWTTQDFTPRTVEISSDGTTYFQIYSSASAYEFGPDVQLFPDKFEHGSGVIQVVPAPSALALLLTGAALTTRRRR